MYQIAFQPGLDKRDDAHHLILRAVSQFLDKKYPGTSIKILNLSIDYEKGTATFEAELTPLHITGKLFDEDGKTLYQPDSKIR